MTISNKLAVVLPGAYISDVLSLNEGNWEPWSYTLPLKITPCPSFPKEFCETLEDLITLTILKNVIIKLLLWKKQMKFFKMMKPGLGIPK